VVERYDCNRSIWAMNFVKDMLFSDVVFSDLPLVLSFKSGKNKLQTLLVIGPGFELTFVRISCEFIEY